MKQPLKYEQVAEKYFQCIKRMHDILPNEADEILGSLNIFDNTYYDEDRFLLNRSLCLEPTHKIFIILGPSGMGKSTSLDSVYMSLPIDFIPKITTRMYRDIYEWSSGSVEHFSVSEFYDAIKKRNLLFPRKIYDHLYAIHANDFRDAINTQTNYLDATVRLLLDCFYDHNYNNDKYSLSRLGEVVDKGKLILLEDNYSKKENLSFHHVIDTTHIESALLLKKLAPKKIILIGFFPEKSSITHGLENRIIEVSEPSGEFTSFIDELAFLSRKKIVQSNTISRLKSIKSKINNYHNIIPYCDYVLSGNFIMNEQNLMTLMLHIDNPLKEFPISSPIKDYIEVDDMLPDEEL